MSAAESRAHRHAGVFRRALRREASHLRDRRRLLAMAIIIAVGGLMAAGIVARGDPAGADARAYWAAVRIWLNGGDPYHPTGPFLPYVYAPWMLPLFTPWAVLPWDVAWVVWRGSSIVLLLWSLDWAYRRRPLETAIVVAVLGFGVTLWLNAGDLVGKIENILLFLSYWIAPWAAVILADWRLRRGRATVSRLVDFGSLPSGALALGSLIIGFVVSLPFQQSSLGEEIRKSTGLPINAISDDVLHYADLAYLIGFAVAFTIFWVGARSMTARPMEQEVAAV